MFGVLLNKKIKTLKHKIVSGLEGRGVQTRPFFYPLHKQPLLSNLNLPNFANLPIAENLYDSGFYLPSGNGYKTNEIEEISAIFNEVLSDIVQQYDDN